MLREKSGIFLGLVRHRKKYFSIPGTMQCARVKLEGNKNISIIPLSCIKFLEK
jgi:hypothetical protein